MRMRPGWLCLLVACSSPTAPPSNQASTTRSIPIVDSHVHLTFLPVADQLAAHGVLAAVDLGAPLHAFTTPYPIQVLRSGPMLTRPNGYPLDSWGSGGYGLGCATETRIDDEIDDLKNRGAGVIKLALDPNGLDPELARAAVQHAHQSKLKVVAHALSDASARLAAEIDVDVLAHTPLEPLSPPTVAAWRAASQRGERAVISTLAAFGGSDIALANLATLREAGVIVLYGTDLGNLRIDGPSSAEIELLHRAGLDTAAIDAAMTTVPWRFWGFPIGSERSGPGAEPLGSVTRGR
jgi:hypothetical protein